MNFEFDIFDFINMTQKKFQINFLFVEGFGWVGPMH